jgi:hypothetical protein
VNIGEKALPGKEWMGLDEEGFESWRPHWHMDFKVPVSRGYNLRQVLRTTETELYVPVNVDRLGSWKRVVCFDGNTLRVSLPLEGTLHLENTNVCTGIDCRVGAQTTYYHLKYGRQTGYTQQ